MGELPREIGNQCRQVLLQCMEFEDDAGLKAVFITTELSPFKSGLKSASSLDERVDLFLEYLLGKYLSDGRPVLPIFLATLLDRYGPDNALHHELAKLSEIVNSVLLPEHNLEINQSEQVKYPCTPSNEQETGKKQVVGLETISEIPVWEGRTQLLKELKAKLVQPGGEIQNTTFLPKVLVLLGQGGIGKTSLSVKLLETVGVGLKPPGLAKDSPYEGAIFFRVNEGTSFDEVAEFFLKALGIEKTEMLKNTQQKINQILIGLAEQRYVVLLDNLEVILHSGNHPQAGKAISTDWGKLLNAFAYGNHRSQIILTSRELPADLGLAGYDDAEPDSELVHIELVTGVAIDDGVKILQQRQLKDRLEDLQWVASRVDGHVFLLTQLAALGKGKPGYLRKHPELVTKNAAKVLKAQLVRQDRPAHDLLQRMCVLRVPIDIRGLTFLRLYTDDVKKDDRFVKAEELRKPAELTEAEIEETEAIVKRLIDSCLVQWHYDEKQCELCYDLHWVIQEFLQAEYITELPKLFKNVYSFYYSTKDSEIPKSLEQLRPCLEAQYLVFQVGNYSEAYKLLRWNLKDYLKPWGHWNLLKDLHTKLLPYLTDADAPDCLNTIGEIYLDFGDWNKAEDYFKKALSIAQEQGDKTNLEISNLHLQLIDNFRESRDLEEQSYQLRLQSKNEIYDQSRMDSFYEFLEDCNRASWSIRAQTYTETLELYKELNHNHYLVDKIVETTVNLGEAKVNSGNLEKAGKILTDALAQVTELKMTKHIAFTNYHLARLERLRGRTEVAEKHYNAARQILQELTAMKDLERIEREWERTKL